METIFVQIPSYRDPECGQTVNDLFTKARHPERIYAGLCLQHAPGHAGEAFMTPGGRERQVRIAAFPANESRGVCWARHKAQQLWEGEDYTLCIDSHTRFAPGWDASLTAQLAECPSPKAVLSAYPACYTPPDRLEADPQPTIVRAHPYSPEGDLRFRGVRLTRAPARPLRGAFCTTSFLFARAGALAREIPFDPRLYFDQEEIALAARLFTHGYDVYSPKDVPLYHYYRGGPAEEKHPPQHWDDDSSWARLQQEGRRRLDYLLGVTPAEEPAIIGDIEPYGLGTARTLKEFEGFCGIDFARRTVSERALRCGFIERLGDYLDLPLHIRGIDDAPPEPPTLASQGLRYTEPFKAFDQALAVRRLRSIPRDGRGARPDRKAPEGILVIRDYLDKKTCRRLTEYAGLQSHARIDVMDPALSTTGNLVVRADEGRITDHVAIDGIACEILNIFNDAHCRRMAPFYDVDFEWYERPQLLRYPPGGRYDPHTDADYWLEESAQWVRVHDRDYSILLYLNDDYSGGELEFVHHGFVIRPRPGMLVAFPSDHRYPHAARPTMSGLRYVLVSWAAAANSKRVQRQMPAGSVYLGQKRRAS